MNWRIATTLSCCDRSLNATLLSIPGREGSPSQDASMQQTPKRFYPVKKIRSKLNLPRFFMSSGNWRRRIQNMYD